jgi:hypothetical protein
VQPDGRGRETVAAAVDRTAQRIVTDVHAAAGGAIGQAEVAALRSATVIGS